MKIHQLEIPEALKSLHTRISGLTASEVEKRLLEFGQNQINEVAKSHFILRFTGQFTHFFAAILWVGAMLAFFSEWRAPGQGMATLGFAIVGVIVINGTFSFWQEYRAERAMEEIRNLIPNQVRVIRSSLNQSIRAAEVVPGDIILLEQGDRVPADCRIIAAFSLRVSNATLTGESVPLARDPQADKCSESLQAQNILFAGTSIVSGEATAVIFSTGMHTEFGKIAHLTQSTERPLSLLQLEVSRFSRIVASLSLTLAIVFFGVGHLAGLSFWENFIFFIGIIVANVPEGLLPTLTLSLAMATQRMAKSKALVRNLNAVGTLGSTTVICTDKTGTLTQNSMRVTELYVLGRQVGSVEIKSDSSVSQTARDLLRGASVCQGLRDPTESALAEFANDHLKQTQTLQKVGEVSFDTDRKRISLFFDEGEKITLFCRGALETVLPLCDVVPSAHEAFLEAESQLAEKGLRVIAFAHRELAVSRFNEKKVPLIEWERNLIMDGLIGLEDPPRPEVFGALARCHSAGIRVMMLTGDHPKTAAAIAREIGLTKTDQPVVLTGAQLHQMSEAQLQLALGKSETIFARIGADQKMRIVQALKRNGEVVAVTGDGVNDAPALKSADIGIAMGVSGTDVAKEAADIILLDDNFATIVEAIQEGRAVFENIRKFLTYILTSNVPELIPYLCFVLFRVPLALTIVQMLAVDLGTDIFPALALGVEKPTPDLMNRPPRPRGEHLVNFPLILRAYFFLGAFEAAAAMAAFFYVLPTGGYVQATTACFSAIILTQIANVFLCRHPRLSAFQLGFRSNPRILFGIFVEVCLLLAVVYTPLGHLIFGTATFERHVWLYLLPFPIMLFVIEELRKAVLRRSFKTPF